LLIALGEWVCRSRIESQVQIVELKFSPIQLQLAVGFADGRIKIYEGDNRGNWNVVVCNLPL
jgi:hypothetical protein